MGAPRRELRADQQIRVNCKLIRSQQPSTSNQWITKFAVRDIQNSRPLAIDVLDLIPHHQWQANVLVCRYNQMPNSDNHSANMQMIHCAND